MVYGYARCSTNEELQDIDRQKRELKKLGVTDEKNIYCEYESGNKRERMELKKILDIVKPGDTIISTEVSRLTRSTSHLCEILEIVQEKKLKLIIGNFTADCSQEEIDPMTKGMLMMWGVFAEMERDIIRQRVKSGMANAKAKGKKIGRPELTKDSIPNRFWKYYAKYNDGSLNISEIAALMDCSRTTIYKYIEVIKR
ncbi:MAG: recombinase family protein [Eubacterium sp.]|nr:recombinase family protein [Eubacterium sp.]